MSLHVSVSSLEDFMTCRRLYYFKRIKKYEKVVFNIPFVVGRTVHTGMNYLLDHQENAVELMGKYFKEEQKTIKKTFQLTPEQQEDLDEQEFITKAMLSAYQIKYGKMLRDIKKVTSEVEGAVQFDDDVIFVIKLDNLFTIRGKKILHELKTSKHITIDYVKRIQTNVQTAIYFYFYNMIYEKATIDEIMYDIIKKPSIRQKKGESKQEFQQRLIEWYHRPDDMAVFHVERFPVPKISQEDIVNTVHKVSQDMLRSKTKEDYYQDFDKCHSYYGDICPYYTLCHDGGESKENLLLYTIRKPFHVSKENKGA